MSLLTIEGLSHSFGEGLLFRDAAASIYKGEHVGIVGANGAGKSTFIKICTGEVVPDRGTVTWHPKITVGSLDQYARIDGDLTVEGFLNTAYASLFRLEREMQDWYTRAAEGDMEALARAAVCQERLEQGGFYGIETEIGRAATGLGLTEMGMERPIRTLSGGQRAKVILAKLLLESPDMLLLDEPTNFLDTEHIAWFSGYLSGYRGAFLVVSHDGAFLEAVSNRILDIEGGKLTKYHGSYKEYLRKKELHKEEYLRRYNAQQREIARTEEFIRRNIAGIKTKMAQGRRTRLEKMERLEAPTLLDRAPAIVFTEAPVTNVEHLRVDNLTIGYDAPLQEGLTFAIKGCSKVVITGFNGVGKSTLVKTLMGELAPLGGTCEFAAQVQPAYFAQEFSWKRADETPLGILRDACPALTTEEARQTLARSGIGSKHAEQSIGTLSGGEQAKLKLCLLSKTPTNFLILDEPTNHLDRTAKDALKDALIAFTGTVLLVSHEEAFYKDWVDRMIPIGAVRDAKENAHGGRTR